MTSYKTSYNYLAREVRRFLYGSSRKVCYRLHNYGNTADNKWLTVDRVGDSVAMPPSSGHCMLSSGNQ